MAGAAAELVACRSSLDDLALDGDGWGMIAPGLHRSYRRGRKRLRSVEEDASVTNLHELRKRVKDLWYQLRLIREADRQMIGEPRRSRARPLRSSRATTTIWRCCGRRCKRRRDAFASPADQRHLLQEIDQRRGELQFAAISLGERIYAEKPKKFTARLAKRYRRSR